MILRCYVSWTCVAQLRHASASLSSGNALTSSSHHTHTSPPITIFRKEIAEGNVKSFPLSVDLPQKKFVDLFSDFDTKRCKLCNESYLQWGSHANACIPHIARESVMLELVRAYCGTPEQMVNMWWQRLHTSKKYQRIPSLSHDNSFKRKRRLLYLLTFLRDKKILRECFNVHQGPSVGLGATKDMAPITSAGRSFEFERLEFAGDGVVKYVFNNRVNDLFPYSEGGVRGRLGYIQFMMDGNEGLARAYDYLELQKLTMSDRVVSKFKSDVVETMFGELQLYIWSTQHDWGTEYVASPFTPEMLPLRALVYHVMEEAAHCVVMYHVEFILQNLMRVVNDNQVKFVRADPALQHDPAARKEYANSLYGSSQLRGGKTSGGSGPGGKTLASVKTVASASSHASGRDMYFQSTNYDAFKLVTHVGGLLPRPFPEASLTATSAFLPHLQRVPTPDAVLHKWQRGTQSWSNFDDGSEGAGGMALAQELQSARGAAQPRGALQRWDVLSLKDAGLVPELV